MSKWCRSALCDYPLLALTDSWTHGAASRHTNAQISHTRPSPRSRSYYSFPIPLRVGGWVGLLVDLQMTAICLPGSLDSLMFTLNNIDCKCPFIATQLNSTSSWVQLSWVVSSGLKTWVELSCVAINGLVSTRPIFLIMMQLSPITVGIYSKFSWIQYLNKKFTNAVITLVHFRSKTPLTCLRWRWVTFAALSRRWTF